MKNTDSILSIGVDHLMFLNEIGNKKTKFPDGQQAVTIENPDQAQGRSVTIVSSIKSFLDLELIISANQALLEAGATETHLYAPYFLGARSDRKFGEGQSNYLKTVICPIVNSQKFKTVTILDPHSDVLEACLDGFRKITNVNFAKAAIRHINGKSPVLVSPDAGALKKIYDVAKAAEIGDVIVANKVRELLTGKIIRTEVPGLDQEPGQKEFIICDDICDGGRTFIEIAKAIREERPKAIFNDKIYLVVTHGIFSAGTDEILNHIDAVYSTDSYSVKGQDIEEAVPGEKLVRYSIY
jgi:ribose-phosphate pyrophosphokinase